MEKIEEINADQYVLEYQATGISEQLVEQYKNFLNKYQMMFVNENVDFTNYDVRSFLSCYVKDPEIRRNLRRGKFHSSETRSIAYKILQYIKWALRQHHPKEIEAELVIPFLRCAKAYKQQGKSFNRYLYRVYRYELKRHIDKMPIDMLDQEKITYIDVWHDNFDWEVTEDVYDFERPLHIEMDDTLELSHPDWIHGDKSTEPFRLLKPHERYILVKYYYENHTDKEIAKMLPYNPKSIHRMRKRLVDYLYESYSKGDLKWIRLSI